MPYHMTTFYGGFQSDNHQCREKRSNNHNLVSSPSVVVRDLLAVRRKQIGASKYSTENQRSQIVHCILTLRPNSAPGMSQTTRKQRLKRGRQTRHHFINVRTNCLCAWPVYTSKIIIHIPFHDTNGPWSVHSGCR